MLKSKSGLLGNKIQYSKSPEIYNRIYLNNKIKCCYNLIDVDSISENLINSLFYEKNFLFINITQPFKEIVLQYVHQLSPEVAFTKSANLLKIVKKNQIKAYNTDYYGLTKSYFHYNLEFKNKNVLIIGTGAVAKTIIYSLRKVKCNVFITSKNIAKIKNIIQNNCNIKIYMGQNVELIFNATSISLQELIDNKTIDLKIIKGALLYDVNYRYENNFSSDCINGTIMLVYQLIKNIEIVFGVFLKLKNVLDSK